MSLSPEEVEKRRHTLGSSEIAAVLGCNPYKSSHDIWLSKMGLADFVENDAVEAGTDFEPVIIARFARHHNVGVRKGEYMIGPEPWMSATPDAYIDGGGVLECKMVGFEAAFEYSSQEDGAPWRHLLQCQWQLACTGEPFAVIAAQMGTRAPRYIRVESDKELQTTMIERARTWWHKYVVTKEPPPVDHTEGARTMLHKLYPSHATPALQADQELEDLAAQLLAIREAYDKVTDQETLLTNKIKERMKDAEAVLGAQWKCTWKRSANGRRPFNFKHQAERDKKRAA